jgi:hypothetical protein
MKDESETTPIYKYWKSRKEIVERVVKDFAVVEEDSENEKDDNEKEIDEEIDEEDDECEDNGGSDDDDEVGEFVMSDEER